MWTNPGLAIVTALAWVLNGIDRFVLGQVQNGIRSSGAEPAVRREIRSDSECFDAHLGDRVRLMVKGTSF